MKEFFTKLTKGRFHYLKGDDIESLLSAACGIFFLVFAIVGICGGEFLVFGSFLFVSILSFKSLIYVC